MSVREEVRCGTETAPHVGGGSMVGGLCHTWLLNPSPDPNQRLGRQRGLGMGVFGKVLGVSCGTGSAYEETNGQALSK